MNWALRCGPYKRQGDFVKLHHWALTVMLQTSGQHRPMAILSGAPPAPIVHEEALDAVAERIL